MDKNNHHKKANVFLQHYKEKMLFGAKGAKNKVIKRTNKLKSKMPSLGQKINMSRSNELFQFNELTKKNYKRVCEAEEYDVKYKSELARVLKKDKNFRQGDFKKYGRYFTLSPKERGIFIKKSIRVDCYPIQRKLKKNSAGYNKECWHTKECKDGLYCNHPAPNTKGFCRSKKKGTRGNNKSNNKSAKKCKKNVDCDSGYTCKGAIRFIKNGKCVINPNYIKNTNNLKSKMRNNYRITY
jgi:hypothetical protein